MHGFVDAIPVSLVTTFHIIASVFLIFFVLIQDSKGGGVFGSSSQSILGPTGAPTLFARLTRYTAILFACTSIILTVQTSPSKRSATDTYVPPAATEKAPPVPNDATPIAPADPAPGSPVKNPPKGK